MTAQSYIASLEEQIDDLKEELSQCQNELKWAKENPKELAEFVAKENADRREFLLKIRALVSERAKVESQYNKHTREFNEKFPHLARPHEDIEDAAKRLKEIDDELATL